MATTLIIYEEVKAQAGTLPSCHPDRLNKHHTIGKRTIRTSSGTTVEPVLRQWILRNSSDTGRICASPKYTMVGLPRSWTNTRSTRRNGDFNKTIRCRGCLPTGKHNIHKPEECTKSSKHSPNGGYTTGI